MDYYTLNADGSYTKVTTNLVPESDLLTIKGSSQSRQSQDQEKIDKLTSDLDSMTTRATAAELASEEVKTQLEPLKIEAAKVPTLEEQVRTLNESSSAAQTQLLSTKRSSVIEKYNISDAAKKAEVEGMTIEALTALESSLAFVGYKPQPNGNGGFNNAPANNGDSSGMTATQKMRAGLEAGLLASGKD